MVDPERVAPVNPVNGVPVDDRVVEELLLRQPELLKVLRLVRLHAAVASRTKKEER